MADKKKSGIAIMPTFVDGEQPTAYKFNTIGSQVQRASYLLESSVGDIWDESYPYSTISSARLSLDQIVSQGVSNFIRTASKGRRLDITSLGRLLGPSSNLNPLILSHSGGAATEKLIVDESLPNSRHSYTLKYLPGNLPTFNDPSVFGTFKIKPSQMSGPGDWSMDANGTIYSFSAINPGTKVTYSTIPAEYHGGPSYLGSTFNVIPDPNQVANGTSEQLILTPQGDGSYLISLPVIRDQQFNSNLNNTFLSETDVNFGTQLEVPIAIVLACGGDSTGLSSSEGIAGSLIPEGMIYLRNEDTEEIYSDASYFYNSRSALKIKPNVELDLNHNYSLITVGTDITSSILDLNKKQFNHSHSREFGEPLVSVYDLGEVNSRAGSTGAYTKSEIQSNPMSQYLHRDGSKGLDVGLNDDNAMRGDLVIGRYSDTLGNIVGAGSHIGSGDTFGLVFGKKSLGGPKISSPWFSNQQNLSISNFEGDISVRCSKETIVEGNDVLIKQNSGSGVIRLEAANNIVADAADNVVLEASNHMTITGDSNHIRGGLTIQHTGSTLGEEGRNSVSEGNWYHPKLHKMSLFKINQPLYAYTSRDDQSTSGRGTNDVNSNLLWYQIELPSWFTDANGYKVYGINVMWSPGSSSPQLREGWNEDDPVSTTSWFGTSTKLSTHFGNGVSWNFTSTNGKIDLWWPLDTANTGLGDGILHPDHLNDIGSYKGVYFDIRVTVEYRYIP